MSDEQQNDQSAEPDAIESRRTEATADEVMVIAWKGHDYKIPRDYGKWPLTFTQERENGRRVNAFAALLGSKQFARFMADDPTNDDFAEFDRLMGKELGLADTGESKASSD